jgi:5-methylcytosine-specific restriction endonuclease McrA
MTESKPCSKCKQIKELSQFHKYSRSKDGHKPYCKACAIKATDKWRKENPEIFKAGQANWTANNRERVAEIKRNWITRNRIQHGINARAWQQRNKEKVAATAGAWKKANKPLVNMYAHKRRALLIENGIYEIRSKELFRLYAAPCFYCGSTQDIEADHVVPVKKKGHHNIGNLLPACRSCNASKGERTIMEWKVWKQKNRV